MSDRFLDLPGIAGHDASAPNVNLLDADNAHFHQTLGNWSGFAANTIAQSTDVDPSSLLPGTTQVMKATYQNDLRFATDTILALGATPHNMAIFVWIPATWDGGDILIGDDGLFAGATDRTDQSVLAGDTGAWRQTWARLTPALGDLAGFMVLRTAVAPTVGRFVYFAAAHWRADTDVTFVPSCRIVGDIDMRASVLPVAFDPSTDQHIIAKRSGTSGYGIRLDSTADSVSVRHGDGVTDRDTALAMDTTAGTKAEIRATLDLATGTWNGYLDNVLSDTDAGFTNTAASPSSEALYAGSENGNEPYQGDIDWVEVRDGIDGPVVARFDAHDFTAGDTNGATATGSAGNTWTINGAASSIVFDAPAVSVVLSSPGPTVVLSTPGPSVTLLGVG